RLNLKDLDIPLARNGLALLRRVSLHFGAWAPDPEVFGAKHERLAGVEGDRQRCPILVEPDFSRPGARRRGRHGESRGWRKRASPSGGRYVILNGSPGVEPGNARSKGWSASVRPRCCRSR